jgi:predicted RNA-binding protein with PUA-like domain
MNYWFIKSPFKNRGWGDAILTGKFILYGIRNHQARKNISEMDIGDIAIYYHDRIALGLMEVITMPYIDPTSSGNWLSIEFEPVKTFLHPLTLEDIKSNDILNKTAIVRQPRLSVVKLTEEEYNNFNKL